MNYDVAVIGAGPAGISAALSCARRGMKTVLCTDRPVLGGNSSSEIRVWTRGATGGGNLFSEEMGRFGQLKLRNLYENPDGNVLFWDEILLDSVISEENLTLYLNLQITNVERDSENRISGISGIQQGNGIRIEIQAKIYIDASGDGEIAYRAGVPFMMGTEGKDVFGETMAEIDSSNNLLGSSIMWQSKRVGHQVTYTPPSYAYPISAVEKMIQKGGRIIAADMQGSDCWWFEYGGVHDTIRDSQNIAFELRKIVFGIWNYIKNSGKFEADDLTLEWVGAFPGKRESRRFIGEHVLTQNEVTANLLCEEAAAYGGWYMDTHPADGIFSNAEKCVQLAVHCYGIPIQCFFNKSYPNLLFTGRAASVSHLAFTSYRIMNSCALAGDACGITASECVRKNMSPQTLVMSKKTDLLDEIAREDVTFTRIFHDRLEDGKITADSEHLHQNRMNNERLHLENNVYLCVPVCGEELVFRLDSDKNHTVKFTAETCSQPSRLVTGKIQKSFSFDVHPGINDIAVLLPPGDGFTILRFEDNSHVCLCLGEELCGVCAGIQREPRIYFPYVQWSGCYRAESALGGFTRPYKGANAWVSSTSKGVLHIQLPEKRMISTIRLYLDADFSSELVSSHCGSWEESHHFYPRKQMPEQLLKDFSIYINGEIAAEIVNNIQRMPVINFPEKLVETIDLKIHDTYGGNAAIFRIAAI